MNPEVGVRAARIVRWLIALGVLSLLAMLSWNWASDRFAGRPNPAFEWSNDAARQWARSLLHIAAPEPADQSALNSAETTQTELCDYGQIAIDQSIELPPAVVADARAALKTVTDQWVASASDEDRALGLQLRIALASVTTHEAFRRKQPECYANLECASAFWAATPAPVTAAVEALAQHAVTTQNPAAYARAFLACHSKRAESRAPTCPAITAARWSQLEPRNAAPWLYIANAAQARNDAPAIEDAVVQLAASQVLDLRWGSEFAVLSSEAAQALPRYVQIAMMADVFGVSAAFAIPNYGTVMSMCTPESMRDIGNRLQLCSAIGELLVRNDTTLIGTAMGIRLGERVGWPSARLMALRAEKSAAQAVMGAGFARDAWFSCTAWERDRSWLRDIARFGESGAARHRIAASGRTSEEIAQEYLEQMKRQFEKSAKAVEAAKSAGVPISPAPTR